MRKSRTDGGRKERRRRRQRDRVARDVLERKKDPFSSARREAMEIVAKLSGGSNFILKPETNQLGKKNQPVTALDVAHALGFSKDKLGKSVAIAISCRRPEEWPKIDALGYELVLGDLLRTMPNALRGGKMYRARILLEHCFMNLVKPETRPTQREGAKVLKADVNVYAAMVKRVEALLEQAGNNAAADCCRYLFAPDGPNDAVVIIERANGALERVTNQFAADKLRQLYDDERLDYLLESIASELPHCPRIVGVLCLPPRAATTQEGDTHA